MKSPSDPLQPHPKDVPPSQRSDSEDELAPYDDRIIGNAFRWSAVALIVLLLLAGVVYYAVTRKPAPLPPKVTQLNAPVTRATVAVEIPEVKFAATTEAAGIQFVHHNGAYGDKLLPETMGGGVAFLDYDNDGRPDLLLVNATDWPWHVTSAQSKATMALYHNEGSGRFANATAGSGLDVSFYGMGVAIGDYDNDGFVDVFMSGVGENHLFHNNSNGTFSDVTATAGMGAQPGQWSTSAAWLDYNNDGRLDLFVCNYVRWSKEIDLEVGYKLVGVGRAYGQPMNFEGVFPCLYRNDGEGHFTDVSVESGMQVKNSATGVPAAKSLGVAPVDLDGDGWIDLVVANDTVPNFVFHNLRNGTFKEIGAVTGVAYDSNGQTRGAMGIDTGRFRNDGALGIAIGNFANEMTALYVTQGGRTRPGLPMFTDEAITEGIGPASRLLLKFGIFFFDYDLDGRLDVLTANGHLEEEITKIQQSQHYAQPAQLFWNAGAEAAGCFLSVPAAKAGQELFQPIVGRGSAFADIDGDGDLDVVLTQVGGRPLLLRNDQQLHHHWLRVKLVGKKNNRDAIGAWVNVGVGDEILSRQVMPTRSYLSQSELPVTFGLGRRTQIDAIEILWPGGTRQKLDPSQVPLDRLTVIEEP